MLHLVFPTHNKEVEEVRTQLLVVAIVFTLLNTCMFCTYTALDVDEKKAYKNSARFG